MSVAAFVRFFFWLWFAAAAAAGHFLLLQRLPPLALPALILTLTAGLLVAYVRIKPLREWTDSLDLRSLVLLHVTRFVGIYFLVLFQRGDLPRAFAVTAGIGDIVVATMALPVALAPIDHTARLRAIFIWNVVGLFDLLFVVSTAVRLNLGDPTQLRAFTHLPLSLLPTFLVPLLLATHAILYVRISREQARR